jgi:predicted transcriptional regulator
MPTPETPTKQRRRPKPELSIFEDELNVPFNKQEFLPDLPPHARGQAPTPEAPDSTQAQVPSSTATIESSNKLEPNLGQTRAKVESELKSNLSQSEAKVEPNQPLVNKLSTNLSQTTPKAEKKVEPQLRPQVEPILSQSEAKVEPNQPLLALVGLQRSILSYIYASCRAEGSKTSAPISIENLANASGTTVSAARKAAQRLEGKGFVARGHYKDGRGGWTQYAIPDAVYNALLLEETRAKVEPNLGQTRAKVEPKLEPQLRPSPPSSSSFLDSGNLKTTTSDLELFENSEIRLAPEWTTVDLSPLGEIGFTQTHLIQLARHGKLSASEVASSIEFFSFDLRRNGKAKALNGSPLNFFMGILRKGIPYTPPENYESSADEARRRTREILERKEQERQAEEQRIRDLEFAEWSRGLTADELGKILPEYARRPGPVQASALKTHFESQVWPGISAKIFSGADEQGQSVAGDPK